MIEFRLMEAIRVLESVDVGPVGPSTKTSNYPEPKLSYEELLGAVDGRFVRKGPIKTEWYRRSVGTLAGEGIPEQRCLDMGEEVVTTYRDVDPATGKVDLSLVPKTHWAKGFARPALPSKPALARAAEVLGWTDNGGNWLRHLKGHRNLLDTIWLIYGRDLSLHHAAIAFSRWRKVRRAYHRDTMARWRDNALGCIESGLRREGVQPSRFELRLAQEVAPIKKNHLTMRQMRQILETNQ